MKNSIVVKIPFWFKGELFEPSAPLNLDDWAKRDEGETTNFPLAVAKANGIGSYSYELEIMESAEVVFENPTGLAVDFFNKDSQEFDFDGFKQVWIGQAYFNDLDKIAKTHLKESLEQNSALYHALLAAFHLGKNS